MSVPNTWLQQLLCSTAANGRGRQTRYLGQARDTTRAWVRRLGPAVGDSRPVASGAGQELAPLQGTSVGQGVTQVLPGGRGSTTIPGDPAPLGDSPKAAAPSQRRVDAPLGGKWCVYCKGFCRLVIQEGEFQALPRGNGGPEHGGFVDFTVRLTAASGSDVSEEAARERPQTSRWMRLFLRCLSIHSFGYFLSI